jgi:hypothetical protein
MLAGSNILYAVFNQEKEFAGPIFKTLEDASNHMNNNKSVIVPLKSGKKTMMSLQVTFDENLKVS